MEKYLWNGGPLALDTRDRVPKDIDFADVDRRWKFLLMTRQIDGMDAIIDYAAENDLLLKPKGFYEAGFSRVGKRFKSYETADWMIDGVDAEHEVLQHCFPSYHIPGITWITELKHEEMAFSHVVHGNEPSIETRYSCVAILAVIPPTEKRMNIE
ncbi:hypothetical protein N8T08_005864 [Aspergillus melleus]|uniref:Uncharacterized protein n=1 Tax=Aspergillus melleus TaxID=138277 RepID=A0ACC3B1C0_9EURO|nr:hypothetical protein N8T08_005864 [Aspergillus melleus]